MVASGYVISAMRFVIEFISNPTTLLLSGKGLIFLPVAMDGSSIAPPA